MALHSSSIDLLPSVAVLGSGPDDPPPTRPLPDLPQEPPSPIEPGDPQPSPTA